jgi:DNA-binding response OmpR family regulator
MNVHKNGNDIFFAVKDNGFGISQQNLDKIFERFYQADDKDTRKSGGAGIVLALTRELVTLLNGTIEVRSIPGIETVFTVRLPVTSLLKFQANIRETSIEKTEVCSETQNKEDILESGLQVKYSLLIIEDNSDVVEYLKACYQKHFSISITGDGKQGFETAINEIPDIIISDVMMPEMNGFELCKKLKNDFRTSHIPIILLTAKADIPSRIEGLEQGADAFIVKPFNQKELLVRMQKLLELRRKLFRRYSNGNGLEFSNDPVIQKEDRFFKKLNESIQKNLNDENYNIQTLCEDLAMSKSQLYRKFKALTNKSAAKYIRTLRMKKAKELLRTTSMNITEVGYEVGIKTPSTFSELFKDEFGESPREFVGHLKK